VQRSGGGVWGGGGWQQIPPPPGDSRGGTPLKFYPPINITEGGGGIENYIFHDFLGERLNECTPSRRSFIKFAPPPPKEIFYPPRFFSESAPDCDFNISAQCNLMS